MLFLQSSLKYPSPVQLEIWKLNRKRLTGVEIANLRQVSRAAVSKLLKEANYRIKTLLENAAKGNKIHIEKMSEKLGYVQGYSNIFKVKAYITYSPINGIQIWYDHKGHCETCEEYVNCRNILLQEFKEREINLHSNEKLRPNELGELLFRILGERLDDHSE